MVKPQLLVNAQATPGQKFLKTPGQSLTPHSQTISQVLSGYNMYIVVYCEKYYEKAYSAKLIHPPYIPQLTAALILQAFNILQAM